MNLQPLFTTSRVVVSVYRIVSTTLLLLYLAQRKRKVRPQPQQFPRDRRVEKAQRYLYGDEDDARDKSARRR
jgi:hypothetical protein